MADAKAAIAERGGGGEAAELALSDPETNQEYTDDGHLLQRNAAVLVRRVPKFRAAPVVKGQEGAPGGPPASSGPAAGAPPAAAPARTDDFGGDLYGDGEDEAAAMALLVADTAEGWAREVGSSRGRGRGRGGGMGGMGRGQRAPRDGPPPPGYVCHRCHQAGHWIKDCPTNGDPTFDVAKVRAPVGIPLERLAQVDEGGLVLPDGTVGVAMADDKTFEKEAATLKAAQAAVVPKELQCALCEKLVTEAVIIGCCQTSFCDPCIRKVLISSGTCPKCNKKDVLCDDLEPNHPLRQAVREFQLSGKVGGGRAVLTIAAAPEAEQPADKKLSSPMHNAQQLAVPPAARPADLRQQAAAAPAADRRPEEMVAMQAAAVKAQRAQALLQAQQRITQQAAFRAKALQAAAQQAQEAPKAVPARSLLSTLKQGNRRASPERYERRPEVRPAVLPPPERRPPARKKLSDIPEKLRGLLPDGPTPFLVRAFMEDFPISEMEYNKLQAEAIAEKRRADRGRDGRDRGRNSGRDRRDDRNRAREMERVREMERARAREMERVREVERARGREMERVREVERLREVERARAREMERLREVERQREKERQRERGPERDWERDRERSRGQKRGRSRGKDRRERKRDRGESDRETLLPPPRTVVVKMDARAGAGPEMKKMDEKSTAPKRGGRRIVFNR